MAVIMPSGIHPKCAGRVKLQHRGHLPKAMQRCSSDLLMCSGGCMIQNERQRRLQQKQILLGWLLQGCCVMLLLAMTLLFVAWVRIEGTRLGYDIAVLHRQQQQLQDQKRLLLLEIHMRQRPAYLYPLLQQRLGLTSAVLGQIQKNL